MTGSARNKTSWIGWLFAAASLLFSGCNTLVRTGTTRIEIVVPAKIRLPGKYTEIAVKYNNANVWFNPLFANYTEGNQLYTDTFNLDSIAAEVYFDVFYQSLKNPFSFDSVILLAPSAWSGISVIDSTPASDSIAGLLTPTGISVPKLAVENLSRLLVRPEENPDGKIKYIDPEYGLYSKQEIEAIAHSPGADLLFSLDFFAQLDGMRYNQYLRNGYQVVISRAFWTIYDLKNENLLFFYHKLDTVFWNKQDLYSAGKNFKKLKQYLPDRRNAVLNAADIAAVNFAEMLVPHWLQV